MSLWSGNTKEKSHSISIVVISLVFLALSIGVFIPLDTFTTAQWYDRQDLVKVYTNSATMFSGSGLWDSIPEVTTEAFFVAIALFVAQMYIGLQSAAVGGYTNRSSNIAIFVWNVVSGKEKLQPNTVKWEKFAWLFAYFFIAAIDTFTDMEYRSGYWSGNIWLTILVSIGIYNFGSEWMLVRGFKSLIEHGPKLLNRPKRQQPNNQRPNNQHQQRGKKNSKPKREQPRATIPSFSLPQLRRDLEDRDER